MTSSKVAKRYARAMLGLSNDRTRLEKWGAELEQLARIIDAPEVARLVESPEVTREVRLRAVAKIAERMDLSFPMRSFAVVMARHGRIADISAIATSYQRQLDDLLGRARATLTFAFEPSSKEVERVVAALAAISHKTIIADTEIDSTLLGGVVAELEGKIYDGSLATRLADAEHRLSE
ncbi:MAG: ATP synthase F1 subunit delta [Candidatus Binataceae bacterium]